MNLGRANTRPVLLVKPLPTLLAAGVHSGQVFGNGLKVIAIRNAPSPIAQEPT